ncbi:MAG TPA: hypothetical protein VH227_06460 [Candidatus Udaeobacter sp.]|jgi:ApbE superfamily uncharacterized protein (UPF0280 family)|nr:hypothetical protein [Candidatus Udaeobacter sp.]
MANEENEKHKKRIDQHVHEAKSHLDKVIQAQPELALKLKPVHDVLAKIASDPHK